jgi:hypothetical protein
MQKTLLSAALLAGLGTATGAAAATEVGMLDAVNPGTAQVTFTDGEVFTFPDGPAFRAHLASFKPGEIVAIDVAHTDKDWNADSIVLAQPVFGYTVP